MNDCIEGAVEEFLADCSVFSEGSCSVARDRIVNHLKRIGPTLVYQRCAGCFCEFLSSGAVFCNLCLGEAKKEAVAEKNSRQKIVEHLEWLETAERLFDDLYKVCPCGNTFISDDYGLCHFCRQGLL